MAPSSWTPGSSVTSARQLHVGVDPGGGRVDDGHAVAHPPLEDAPVHLRAERRELDPVVGALGLHHVVDRERGHGAAVLARQRDRVGEVVLALRVVVADPRQRRVEELRVERDDAAVDLADRGVLLARVVLLHDRGDTVVVADDAPVAGGVGDHTGEHAHRDLGVAVELHEPLERLALEERRVAVRHHDGAGAGLGRQGVPGDPDRVRRTLLGVLHRHHDVGLDLLDVRPDLLALVADDRDDPGGLELPGRVQDVPDHAAPRERVQHLHGLGLHPGAATGSEDDHRHVVRHARSFVDSSPGRSRTCVACPDSKSGGPYRQTNRGSIRATRLSVQRPYGSAGRARPGAVHSHGRQTNRGMPLGGTRLSVRVCRYGPPGGGALSWPADQPGNVHKRLSVRVCRQGPPGGGALSWPADQPGNASRRHKAIGAVCLHGPPAGRRQTADFSAAAIRSCSIAG